MIEYFYESLNNNVELKITTKNNKTMKVIVTNYDEIYLYYKFKNSNKESKIYIKNIYNAGFSNHKDEVSIKLKKLGLNSNLEKYTSYYKNCINKLENSNYDFKKNIYNYIFDNIYNQNETNLLVKYLKGEKEIKKEANNNIYLLNNSNISQKEAINNAINNDISIIQGPPGTGKTTTIISLIANFILDNKNVVVVSKNNSAVDNIIEEFEKTTLPEFYLRFGRKEDYMTPLQNLIYDKINNLKKQFNKIKENDINIGKLKELQLKLNKLEKEINELITIKNMLVDLKNQKKFMDKEQRIYNFKELLTENEMKIICEKNATKNKLVKIFEYSKKHKFNFIERLIIRYYYCIYGNTDEINQKFYAISQLLKEVYIKKEIADKSMFLLKNKLEDKQKEVKELYKEYINISIKIFESHLKNKITKNLEQLENYDLSKIAFNIYPLILTTADAFLSNFKDLIKNDKKIDVIIIDEASQCDIITGLPLLYMAKKLIVVGDEKQLSAITNLEIKTDLLEAYRYDNNTFLNSIKNVFSPIEKTLEEHYRCDYNIINFCNKFYYDNKLKIYTESSPSSIKIVDANKYKGAENNNGSFYNYRECNTIEELVNKKLDYFVITPFKAQGKELKKRFEEKRAGTIHTFQGKGADEVYFTTVLNDLPSCNNHIKGKHNMFTQELVNVAVSRAKKKFILVTDKEYFQKNTILVKEINNLIDYIKIYGKKIDDNTSCWYDYLYTNIPYYRKTELYDNEYEEVTHKNINKILKETNYICKAKKLLSELILNEQFLKNNPLIRNYIRNGAHADFSIFDKRTGKLKLVIELDGKEHYKENQKINDGYKNKAFNSMSIPMIRIKSKEDISDSKIINILKKYIEI